MSIRTETPPQKIGIGYKVCVYKDGCLYPPIVNPSGLPTPIGVWLDADEGTMASGRPQVKMGGKGMQGESGTLAYRPGWHLGDVPRAKQFDCEKSSKDTDGLFPRDFVWVLTEYSKDEDYSNDATAYGITPNGSFRHSYAGLPHVPIDGFYRYKINSNDSTESVVISGAIRMLRVLGDSEVNAILQENGYTPVQRQGGAKEAVDFPLVKDLNAVDNPKFKEWFGKSEVVDNDGKPLIVYHGSRNGGFSVFDNTKSNGRTLAPDGTSFFSDSKEVMMSYSGVRTDADYHERGAGNYAVYLKIEDPYIIDFCGATWEGDLYGKYSVFISEGTEVNGELTEEAYYLENEWGEDAYFNSREDAEAAIKAHGCNLEDVGDIHDKSKKICINEDPYIGYSTNDVAEEAREMGYDGVIIHNVIDEGPKLSTSREPATVYITFRPEQIKSAYDNIGTYDGKNPDIRFARRGGKPIDWEGIQKGDPLNTVKSLLKKNNSEESLPKEPPHDDSKRIVERVEEFLVKHGVVNTVDGRRANMANPDNFTGGRPSITQRARHLVTQQIGKKDRTKRVFDPARIPFVWAVPRTLESADIVAKGKRHNRDHIYYLKNYKVDNMQKTHLVITDMQGKVLEHGDADRLITQYDTNLKEPFDDSIRITYKNRELNNSSLEALLIPDTATTSTSPRPDTSTTRPEPTDTLSNPDGGVASTAQTRGVSRREVKHNTYKINDSSEKVNTESEKNEDYSPTPISDKLVRDDGDHYSPIPISENNFEHLLQTLKKTGLAKDVITDVDEMRARLAEEFGVGDARRGLATVWRTEGMIG